MHKNVFDIANVAYVTHPLSILNSSGIWDGKICGVEVPSERAIDIDTHVNYAIARFLKEQYLAIDVETHDL